MLESFNTDKFEYKRLSQEEQEKRGILGRLVGKIADTKNPTRNGRLYSNELWEQVFNDPIMKEKIDNHLLLGQLGHPQDEEEINIEKAAICMAEQPKKGKDGFLYGVFDILSTPAGKILKSLCDYGCNVAISSRGTGDLYYDENGNEAVDPDTYVCETFDIVLVPGVSQARLQYVNEALDTKKYNKTLRQKLSEELNKASEEDKEIMKKTLKDLDININEEAAEYVATVGDSKIYKVGNRYTTSYRGETISSDDFDKLVYALKDMEYAHAEKIMNLPEKLVEPPKEDLDQIKSQLNDLGFDIEREGETLMGNKHLQLKLRGGNFNVEDLKNYADRLSSFSDVWHDSGIPITYNIGLDDKFNITCGLDILKKYIPDSEVSEELKDEDGWGETIPSELEDTFEDLSALMYEVRNCVRGSVATNGKTVEDLVQELRTFADRLNDDADRLNRDKDNLNEDTSIVKHGDEDNADNYHSAVWYIGGSNNFELSTDDLGGGPNENKPRYTASRWSHTYKNIQEMEDDIKNLQSMIKLVKDLESKDFENGGLTESKKNESIKKDCSDKEEDCNNKDADNVGDELLGQLQEAFSKSAKLEKDNLSLQEKLSVCDAKEIKLKEELSKAKKAMISLSTSSKYMHELREKYEDLADELKNKNKLLESTKNNLRETKLKLSSIKKNENSIKKLNDEISSLKEELNKKDSDIGKLKKLAIKYKSQLQESKNSYIRSQAYAHGLSEDDIRSQLKESYSLRDVDSICEKLSEHKKNMSKLPFRINENTKLNFKSSKNDLIRGGLIDDDSISENLLRMLDN